VKRPLPPELPFDWKPEYIYVPSAPSLTGEIIGNVQEFLGSLNAADVGDLGKQLNALAEALNRKVDNLAVADLSREALGLLSDARTALQRIDKASPPWPVPPSPSAPARWAGRCLRPPPMSLSSPRRPSRPSGCPIPCAWAGCGSRPYSLGGRWSFASTT
jgi:hypothetical protein